MRKAMLLFGTLAGIIFFTTVYVLAANVPDYSHLSDTVSEIGEIGSPVETVYKSGMLAAHLSTVLFGIGLLLFSRNKKISAAPAVLVTFYGLVGIGTALFPSPHPAHNLFGLAMVIGYMAPLALAIAWRGSEPLRTQTRISWVVAALILVSIFLNISPLFTRDLFPLEYYGVVQRSAFVLFYGWLAVTGFQCRQQQSLID